MKVYRVRAIIERDMRKFFRSPALMMTSMVFPLMQLIVLGYAFGGKIKNVNLALVDEDHGAESRVVRERLNAIVEGPQTFRIIEYSNLPDAMTDLRAGFVKAVLDIPQDFSQRVLRNEKPRLGFIEDNTDNFTASGILERVQELQTSLNGPVLPPLQSGQSPASNLTSVANPERLPGKIVIQTVEVYPYIEYIKYLLAGSISISIFVVAMIGGGIVFIDDKARGLHEGYLATPLSKADLVLGLVSSGAIKGLMAGLTITLIGGLIAGIERLWDPVRLLLSGDRADGNRAGHDQLHVSADGARQRSAGAARHFRRAEYPALFSFGGHLPDGGVSRLAAMDLRRRSIHLRGARAEKSSAQEYGFRGDLPGCGHSVWVLDPPDQRMCFAIQASDLAPICEMAKATTLLTRESS